MNFESKVEIKNKILKYQDDTKMSWNELARKLRTSASVLSDLKKGNYPSDNKMSAIGNNIDRLIYLRNMNIKIIPEKDVKTVKTNFTNIVFGFCDDNSESKSFVAMTGRGGIGKTRSLKLYAEKNTDAVLVEVSKMVTITYLLDLIAAALNLTLISRNKSGMFAEILEALKSDKKTLIIDEAEELNSDMIDTLRRFWDYCGNLTLILCGRPRLKVKLMGYRMKDEQIFERIQCIFCLGESGEAEIKKIIKTGMGLEFKETVYKKIFECSGGVPRVAVNLAIQAQRLALAGQQREVTPSIVHQALKFLIVKKSV